MPQDPSSMASFDPVLAEWKSFATNTHHGLVEKCLKMAQLLEYPDLDVSKYVSDLRALRESFRLDLDANSDPTSRIKALGSYVFRTCGFRGNMEDHYDPRNNFLNEVMDRRSGIAITISIVYAEIARGAGLEMRLISFPGRVLVGYNDIIIDPLVGGQILVHSDLQVILEEIGAHNLEVPSQMVAEATPERILVRMARNLKHSYIHSYAHQKALQCTQFALALENDSAEDLRDAGLLRARLQDRDGALNDLNRYLELNPNGDDIDHVLEIIHQMRSSQ